jgi:hypothetical protein
LLSKGAESIILYICMWIETKVNSLSNLNHILLQAASSLKTSRVIPPKKKNVDSDSTLFLHWTYHPKDLQQQDIHRMYESILQPYTPHDRMVVAISRPRNYVLTKAALKLLDNLNLQELIWLNNMQAN